MTTENKIQTYTFNELFYPLEKGIQKLTSYAIYRSLDYEGELVPLWGGNQEHEIATQFVSVNAKNKDNKPIRVFSGPCLIISLDGSAGSMTYKAEGTKFALNHHAGVLRGKNPKILNIEYFKYRYESFLRNLAVSDGSKTLSKKLLENQTFELPDIQEQQLILKRYKKLGSIRNMLKEHGLLKEIDELLSKQVLM